VTAALVFLVLFCFSAFFHFFLLFLLKFAAACRSFRHVSKPVFLLQPTQKDYGIRFDRVGEALQDAAAYAAVVAHRPPAKTSWPLASLLPFKIPGLYTSVSLGFKVPSLLPISFLQHVTQV
jgi:hypothetical protein